MNIAVISTLSNFQNQQLQKEADTRGLNLQRIPLGPISVTDLPNNKTVQRLKSYDVVLFRNGADRVTKCTIGKELTKHGVKFINSGYYKNPLLNSKIFQIHTISSQGIRCPKTITLKKHSLITPELLHQQFTTIEKKLPLPFIMKPEEGSLGMDVELIKSESDFVKVYNKSRPTNLMIQEFISNDGDYRVIVVDSQAVASFKRIPKEGEFRANITIGGHGETIDNTALREQLHQMAVKIAKTLNLEICGIDIIRSKHNKNLYFIESNSSPQWKGLQSTTGIEVAKHILDYIERLKR